MPNPSRPQVLLWCLTSLGVTIGWGEGAAEAADSVRPNIVWVMAEDISTELGCYGHPAVSTPRIDAMAEAGCRFEWAFATAPSCTPSRNAMMTGLYQTRTDLQDQRRGGVVLPPDVRPFTHLLQEAGYYTALGCGYSDKTDLNFDAEHLFDGKDWSGREPDQPFFAQITLYSTHRLPANAETAWTQLRAKSLRPVDVDRVELPPYFPDHPTCRLDWAQYLDSIQYIDRQMGEIIDRLEREGVAAQTIVIFIGDNGRCHLRGKCWLYDGGIHVPCIVKWPGCTSPGSVRSDLVSLLDVTATIVDAAGVECPDQYDGQPLWGDDFRPRERIFAARDLIDEIRDPMRCVRTERYKYIRNYRPENGYRDCQYVQENRPMLPVIRKLDAKGKLNQAQSLILQATKPAEELYDLKADPFEIHNLAESPEGAAILTSLSAQLDEWLAETGDQGLERWRQLPESR